MPTMAKQRMEEHLAYIEIVTLLDSQISIPYWYKVTKIGNDLESLLKIYTHIFQKKIQACQCHLILQIKHIMLERAPDLYSSTKFKHVNSSIWGRKIVDIF
jgi:hypothetical protein